LHGVLVCATPLLAITSLNFVTSNASDMSDGKLSNRDCFRPNMRKEQTGWVHSFVVWHWQAKFAEHINRPASQDIDSALRTKHTGDSHGIQPIHSTAKQLCWYYILLKL